MCSRAIFSLVVKRMERKYPQITTFEAILPHELVAQEHFYFSNYNLETGQVTLNKEGIKKRQHDM
jgi:hypothetical protein